MAAGKEIRTKISSIQSTQKITSAMEMVAASKMRRAQDRMQLGKPYAQRMRAVVGHIANSTPEYRHAYMQEREVKRAGYIIVSTDRGLCGGLNINLFKAAIQSMKAQQEQGVEVELCLVGAKSAGFFASVGGNVTATVRDLGEEPALEDLIGGVKTMLDAYTEGRIDALYLAGNEFVNTMTQSPQVEQLLPLRAEENESLSHHWDYVYEPDARELTRCIDGAIHRVTGVSGGGGERRLRAGGRMIAMKSATDNAGELIEELQLVYNKARQAAITQELAEIVGGAAAIG